MTIQVDSREKQKAISGILRDFRTAGVNYYISKLYVGDYMSLDNPRVVVDRKQNLTEICGNVCQQHERFRRELIRAQEAGIRLVILCEHGHGIQCLEDVLFWRNPREIVRKRINGHWTIVHQKVMQGDVLYRILCTMQRKYGVQFLFCDKEETGQKIVELLGGRNDG